MRNEMLPTNNNNHTFHCFALTFAFVGLVSTMLLSPGSNAITTGGSGDPIRNDSDSICSDSIDFNSELQKVVTACQSFPRTCGSLKDIRDPARNSQRTDRALARRFHYLSAEDHS